MIGPSLQASLLAVLRAASPPTEDPREVRDRASPPLDVPRRPLQRDEAPRAMDRAPEEDVEDARRSGQLEEALREVPGVSLMDRQNAALGDRLVMRGAGARSQFGPGGVGGLDPELDPALTRELEGGVRARGGGLSAEVVGWAARVGDALVPTEDDEGQVFFQNAGRVLRRGIETRVGWAPSQRWGLLVTHTYARHTFREFETPDGDFAGNRVPGVPDHVLHGAVTWRPLPGLRLRVDGRWVGAYPVDDANTEENPAHTVVDAHASWEIDLGGGRAVTPFVAAENLLDERYSASVVPNAFGGRYFEPAPGLTVSGGVQGTF